MSLRVDFNDREGRVHIAEDSLYANSPLRGAVLSKNPAEGVMLMLKKGMEIPASSIRATLGARGLNAQNIRNNVGEDGSAQKDVLVVQNHSPAEIAAALQTLDVYAADKRCEGILSSPQLAEEIKKGFDGHAQGRVTGAASRG